MIFGVSWSVVALLVVFHLAQFENQRWMRAWSNGRRGASDLVGAVVALSGLFALVTSLAFVVFFWMSFGWAAGLLALASMFLTPLAWSGLGVFAPWTIDNPLLWIVATIAVWPLGISLLLQSWPW